MKPGAEQIAEIPVTMLQCAAFGCLNRATHRHSKGRMSSPMCDEHRKDKVITPAVFTKPSTGSKYADKMINDAVDHALLRLAPMIRDIMREEIKRNLQLED